MKLQVIEYLAVMSLGQELHIDAAWSRNILPLIKPRTIKAKNILAGKSHLHNPG